MLVRVGILFISSLCIPVYAQNRFDSQYFDEPKGSSHIVKSTQAQKHSTLFRSCTISGPPNTIYVFCNKEPPRKYTDITLPDGRTITIMLPVEDRPDCPRGYNKLKCIDCGGHKRVTFPSGRTASRCRGVSRAFTST
jgi:hypothetical protein